MIASRRISIHCCAVLALVITGCAAAQPHGAGAAQARDAGAIALEVDATDLDHKVLRVRQVVPVAPGRIKLWYPRWLPGWHGPYGDTTPLAGLTVRAGGAALPWTRDALDPNAFHVDVPAGANALELEFQHLAPTGRSGLRMTRELVHLSWNLAVLYPADRGADSIVVAPRLKLPEGWRHASSLPVRSESGGWVAFDQVSLETLVDSPVFAGRHVRRVELDSPAAAQPVVLHVFADDADTLAASDEQLAAHRRLVEQADRLFGARHFRRYEFLLGLSRQLAGAGLEHHESSENIVWPDYFKDWGKAIRARELLPHEYIHSWNGKFRRPAELTAANFNSPTRNSLLWVYEGLTQYWARVLAARSGLASSEQTRELIARVGARYRAMPGRAWRSLLDTTNNGIVASSRELNWYSWQRGWDYYDEATYLWLDVDTWIREKSGDARSLDDFARAFFGAPTLRRADGGIGVRRYTFDDVVAALNAVQPNDWAAFLRERIDRTESRRDALLDGVERSGWRIEFTDKESDFATSDHPADADEPRPQNLLHSIGVRVGKDGLLAEVLWDGPAYRAGLAPGVQIVAVNLDAYKPERLAAAIQGNRDGSRPIALLVKEGERFRNVTIDWRGGLRYPALVRIEGTADRLARILAPR